MSRVSSLDLDAESQTELAALKRALRLAEGFTLYVARTNTATLRRQIIADLRASLSRPLVGLTLSPGEPPYEQIARVAGSAPADAVLSVEGLDALAPSDDPDWLLKQLNWRRAVYRRLGRPLLLWIPEYLLLLLMRHAPDFFDWHSGFFEFTTPGPALAETTRQAYAIGDVEQEDLTVAQKRERIILLRGLLDEYAGKEPEVRRARVALLGKLGILYYGLGDFARAIRTFEQALTISREIGDRHREAASLDNLSEAYRSLGKAARAIESCEQALIISREIGDQRREGSILGNLGVAYLDLGDVARAIEYYEAALTIAREISDRRREGRHLGNLGLAYRVLGQVHKVVRYYEAALAIAKEIGDRRREGAWLGNLGGAYHDLGEVEQTVEYYEQALQIAREIGNRHGEGIDLGNLGNAYSDLGDVRKAIDYYEQALIIAREIDDRRREVTALGNLGNAYRDLGEMARAIEYYEQALAITRKIGDRSGESFWSWNLGLLYEDSDPARAAELMSVRVAYEREIGHPDAEPHAARVQEIRRRTADGQD